MLKYTKDVSKLEIKSNVIYEIRQKRETFKRKATSHLHASFSISVDIKTR